MNVLHESRVRRHGAIATAWLAVLLLAGFAVWSAKARTAQAETASPVEAAGGAHPSSAATAPGAIAEAYLPVDGGRIWYRTIRGGSGTPIILLHGGPGFSSYYLKPLEALADDRTVVRYDQLGGGKSDRIADSTLFTIDHFVRELDALRAHLGYEKIDLLGHSWGTILAVEYYRAHPEHVASLVLCSPALDLAAWEANARRLEATLSDSAQQAIREADAAHSYDSPAYQGAMDEFYGKYVWRHPIPADLDSTMSTMNPLIYNYMQGPSEFTMTGTLKGYDATTFLKEIAVPTLYTVGEFDEAGPDNVKRFAAMTPGAKLVVIPGAAHITTWDNPRDTIAAVRAFLRAVDTPHAKG